MGVYTVAHGISGVPALLACSVWFVILTQIRIQFTGYGRHSRSKTLGSSSFSGKYKELLLRCTDEEARAPTYSNFCQPKREREADG